MFNTIGRFTHLELWFNCLDVLGNGHGYHNVGVKYSYKVYLHVKVVLVINTKQHVEIKNSTRDPTKRRWNIFISLHSCP